MELNTEIAVSQICKQPKVHNNCQPMVLAVGGLIFKSLWTGQHMVWHLHKCCRRCITNSFQLLTIPNLCSLKALLEQLLQWGTGSQKFSTWYSMGTIHFPVNRKVCLSFCKMKNKFNNYFAGWHQYETSPLKLNINNWIAVSGHNLLWGHVRWKVSTIEIGLLYDKVFNKSLWISEWPCHFLSRSFGSPGTAKHEMIIQSQKALFTPLNYLHFDKHHCKWWRLFHFRKEPVSSTEATSLDWHYFHNAGSKSCLALFSLFIHCYLLPESCQFWRGCLRHKFLLSDDQRELENTTACSFHPLHLAPAEQDGQPGLLPHLRRRRKPLDDDQVWIRTWGPTPFRGTLGILWAGVDLLCGDPTTQVVLLVPPVSQSRHFERPHFCVSEWPSACHWCAGWKSKKEQAQSAWRKSCGWENDQGLPYQGF